MGAGGGGGADLITHGTGGGGAALITHGTGRGGAALITGGRCDADVGAGIVPPEDIPDDATKVRGTISRLTGGIKYTGKIPILENILFILLPLKVFLL